MLHKTSHYTYCFCRTYPNTMATTNTLAFINLWIFKSLFIFYHADCLLWTNCITCCTATTVFFFYVKYRDYFFIFIHHLIFHPPLSDNNSFSDSPAFIVCGFQILFYKILPLFLPKTLDKQFKKCDALRPLIKKREFNKIKSISKVLWYNLTEY